MRDNCEEIRILRFCSFDSGALFSLGVVRGAGDILYLVRKLFVVLSKRDLLPNRLVDPHV